MLLLGVAVSHELPYSDESHILPNQNKNLMGYWLDLFTGTTWHLRVSAFSKLMEKVNGIRQLGIAASLNPQFPESAAQYFDPSAGD